MYAENPNVAAKLRIKKAKEIGQAFSKALKKPPKVIKIQEKRPAFNHELLKRIIQNMNIDAANAEGLQV
jgi:hypothetical protein